MQKECTFLRNTHQFTPSALVDGYDGCINSFGK
jgi:hypothetical protein